MKIPKKVVFDVYVGREKNETCLPSVGATGRKHTLENIMQKFWNLYLD